LAQESVTFTTLKFFVTYESDQWVRVVVIGKPFQPSFAYWADLLFTKKMKGYEYYPRCLHYTYLG
jgi:hypothetical protein